MTAILFDFNGTMFFDEKFQEISWRQFIKNKTGRNATEEEFQKYIHGRNAEFTMQYFFNQSFSRKEIEQLEEEKEVIYRKLCLESKEFKLADGLIDFLDKIQQKEIAVNIATASGWNNVKFFFEHMNLSKWFDLKKVVYNDGTLAGKPAPDFYLKAAKNIMVPIEDCYVFEDSYSGVESAKRANAKGVIKVASMKSPSEPQESILYVIKDYTDKNLNTIIL